MAVFSKTPVRNGRNRPWFFRLSFVGLLLTAILGAMLWQAAELTSLNAIEAEVAQWKPIAGSIRLLLIGALAIFWPRLFDLATRSERINPDTKQKLHLLHQLRWRVITWLLIIELLIGQNIISRFAVSVMAIASP